VGPFTAADPFSDDISHTLTSGDGTKTVCVQYRDAAGNESMTATDTILLDTLKPHSSASSPATNNDDTITIS
jgi:hypothetical protein